MNSLSYPELALLLSVRLLLLTKHSAEFVEEQKLIIKSMNITRECKSLCIETLDSIERE